LPPSAHIEEEGYKKALKYMRNGECGMAGDMIESSKTPYADYLCVDTIKNIFLISLTNTRL
jgi:hypothetical protein